MNTSTRNGIAAGAKVLAAAGAGALVTAAIVGSAFALLAPSPHGNPPSSTSTSAAVVVFRGVGEAPEADPTPTPAPTPVVEPEPAPAPVEPAPAPAPDPVYGQYPSGYPVPFIPSSDPNNAAGGDYDVSACASGTASTVGGSVLCD